MECKKTEIDNSRMVDELRKEIETLRSLNLELHVENEKLSGENRALKKAVNEYEQTFQMQNDHVSSLRDLAVQDREWLDLKVSYRQSRLDEIKKKTDAAKRRASNCF